MSPRPHEVTVPAPSSPFRRPLRRIRDSVETALVRAALSLPEPVQRRLAGPAVRRDGQELAVETQLLLRLQRWAREPAIGDLSLEEGRAAVVRQAGLVGGRLPVGAVRDLDLDGAAGPLRARLYTPLARLGRAPAPLLLYFHGGAMSAGDLDSHDAPCRFLAEQAGVKVLAVDYRLAPEHPYPAAVDDADAALRWLVAHADELGSDPTRLAVGGDSAGGYLAASAALTAAREGLPLAHQLLVYPVTDFVGRSRSRAVFGEGFYLTERWMDEAEATYFPPGADRADGRASVLHASLPAGLAPALVVTAGFDPLRDEGEAYADRLAEAGVSVERLRFAGQIHGFHNVVGVGRAALEANRVVAAHLRAALGG